MYISFYNLVTKDYTKAHDNDVYFLPAMNKFLYKTFYVCHWTFQTYSKYQKWNGKVNISDTEKGILYAIAVLHDQILGIEQEFFKLDT